MGIRCAFGEFIVHHEKVVGLAVFLQQDAIPAVVVDERVARLCGLVHMVVGGIPRQYPVGLLCDVRATTRKGQSHRSIDGPTQPIIVHMAADADHRNGGIGLQIELELGHDDRTCSKEYRGIPACRWRSNVATLPTDGPNGPEPFNRRSCPSGPSKARAGTDGVGGAPP